MNTDGFCGPMVEDNWSVNDPTFLRFVKSIWPESEAGKYGRFIYTFHSKCNS